MTAFWVTSFDHLESQTLAKLAKRSTNQHANTAAIASLQCSLAQTHAYGPYTDIQTTLTTHIIASIGHQKTLKYTHVCPGVMLRNDKLCTVDQMTTNGHMLIKHKTSIAVKRIIHTSFTNAGCEQFSVGWGKTWVCTGADTV